MTVENTNNTISYTGNSSVTTFAYNFLTYSADHIFIYFDDVLQSSGFTITGVGDDNGGDIIFVSPPDAGVTIRIDRTVPDTQLLEYREYGPFPAKANERGLDLLTMAVQQNARELERASSVKMDKQPLATEDNIIVFDDAGNSKDSGIDSNDIRTINDDIANINNQIAGNRLAYMGCFSDTEEYLSFTSNSMVIHADTSDVYIYCFGDYTELLPKTKIQLTSIDSTTRYIIYNSLTKTFRAEVRLNLGLDSKDHLFAIRTSLGVVMANAKRYTYNGENEVANLKTLPKRQATVMPFASSNVATLLYDTQNNQVRFPATTELWLYDLNDAVAMSTLSLSLDPSDSDYYLVQLDPLDRAILWDKKQQIIYGSPRKSDFDDNIVLIAELRNTGVFNYNSSYYLLDGVKYAVTGRDTEDKRGYIQIASSKSTAFDFKSDGSIKIDTSQSLTLYGRNLNTYHSIPNTGVLTVAPVGDSRFLIYNKEDNTWLNYNSKPKIKDNMYIIAERLSDGSIVWVSNFDYYIDGADKNYSTRDSWAIIANPSGKALTSVINFDFAKRKVFIKAPNPNGIYTPLGFEYFSASNETIVNGIIEIDYPSTSRRLAYNTKTKLFRVLVNEKNKLNEGEYFIAQTSSKAVLRVEASAYEVNGVLKTTSSESFNDNKILKNYVKGQLRIAEKYSIPALDLFKVGGVNYQNQEGYILEDDVHYSNAGYEKFTRATTDFLRTHLGLTTTGKTIGVFGASYSVYPESQTCKNNWVSELGVTYTDYGVGGASYTNTDLALNIPNQITGASSHDLYVIWGGLNDCGAGADIGDERSPVDIKTQSGGMSKLIEDIYTLNPLAQIVVFTSLKAFVSPIYWDTSYIRT